jgi:uncharacterized protein YjbI with pentapeptide repeats
MAHGLPDDYVLDLHGAFLRGADLSFTKLRRAKLAGADLSRATLRGSDLAGADLRGTILRGADLTDVTNLTPEQLAHALIDETTRLPDYLAAAPSPVPTPAA